MYKMYSLANTVDMMTSADYKERFLAEYIQASIRLNKLVTMLDQFEAGTLPFKPTCPIELLKKQMTTMFSYKNLLVQRASCENIELPSEKQLKM